MRPCAMMTWRRESHRLLVEYDGDVPTSWRIFKFGLAEPYRYETWHGEKLIGICDNPEDAKQLKEAHVRADVAVSSKL